MLNIQYAPRLHKLVNTHKPDINHQPADEWCISSSSFNMYCLIISPCSRLIPIHITQEDACWKGPTDLEIYVVRYVIRSKAVGISGARLRIFT